MRTCWIAVLLRSPNASSGHLNPCQTLQTDATTDHCTLATEHAAVDPTPAFFQVHNSTIDGPEAGMTRVRETPECYVVKNI